MRELDWSFPTRLRLALATAREMLAAAGPLEACLDEALAEAERSVAPTAGDLGAIDARLVQPTRPRGLTHWEEEIEDDPVGARVRSATFDRYQTVSWALAADPPSTYIFALGAIGDGSPGPHVTRLPVAPDVNHFAQDKDAAIANRDRVLIPALERDETVALDFAGVRITTQSFVHALLYGVVRRFGEAALERLPVYAASRQVRSVIRLVAAYALEDRRSDEVGQNGPGLTSESDD